jgi:hypothetical protein
MNEKEAWRPTEAEAAAIRAGGRITPAAEWDCATVEERERINPAFNPHRRWFEQAENRAVHFPRSDDKK